MARMKTTGRNHLNDRNREVIGKMLRAEELNCRCSPPRRVFVCSSHPLAGRASVTFDDLDDYPYLPMSRVT
ncbi:MAG: hypothetical protein ACLT98_07835 [Eggerthellaceae bacterium]